MAAQGPPHQVFRFKVKKPSLVSLSISVLHEEYLQILSEIVQDWWKENELPVLSHCEIELSSCGGAFCICSIC